MEEFYELLTEVLPRNYNCLGCGEAMWTKYADGHIGYDCLNCDYERNRQKNTLEIAGYVGRCHAPLEPPPPHIEVRDKLERASWEEEHEAKYYRRINGVT